MQKYKKGIICLLILIGVLVTFGLLNNSSNFDSTSNGSTLDGSVNTTIGAFRNSAYYRTIQNLEKQYQTVTIDEPQYFLAGVGQLESYEGKTGILLQKNESTEIVVNVDKTGLYNLGFVYAAEEDFLNQPHINIQINGEEQYTELSDLALNVEWGIDNEFKTNSYGNQLLPTSFSYNVWYEEFISDYNARYEEPFKVLLKQGDNTIKVTNLLADVLINSAFLGTYEEVISYDAYANLHKNKSVSSSSIGEIQGQDIYSKNDIEIKSGYYKDPSMSPASYNYTVLNMLDGSSSNRGGTKTTYQFEVKDSGMYKITLNYLQNKANGLTVGRNIYIDNKIPFAELQAYQFNESKDWTNHTLGNSDGDFWFYLDAGVHTISLEATTSMYTAYIEELYNVMDLVNEIGLNVSSITGGSTDQFIDWNIEKYLPTLKEDLLLYADVIKRIYNELNEISPENASELALLAQAATGLERLSTNVNKIHLKLSELNSGSGSAYQLIGNTIASLLTQELSLDTIYITNDNYKLPRGNAWFLEDFWFSVRAFFFSFFDDRYSVSTSDDGILDVWVAQGSLYQDLIQNLADEQFTGVENADGSVNPKVKVNILPSTQKLILNNATNTNPDVVLSIDSWEPYNMALRGMLEDLSTYEGFDDVSSNIYANTFTPLICGEGVYGIPETSGIQLMFYRKDIFNFLDIESPNTYEEVIQILPILQSYQMNFYHPLGNDTSYKGYSATTPFIYAFGGEVYSEFGYETTLNTENNIAAIDFMTSLYTIYNMPQQISNFFEHFRSGTIPIGIADIGTYLQLKYAAPELSGQWGVVPVPGFDTDNDGEVERWTTAYGKASMLFSSSNMKDEGWEFIKWWNSTTTQVNYLNSIKSSLGERYLLLPANMEALELSPWDQEIKTQYTEGAKWSRIPAILPGSYVVERELSNVWNKVVVERVDVRVAVLQSLDVVNRELARKFDEFDFYNGSNNGTKYIVPTNSNISNWVKGKGYE